jgi:hypothetical protein
MCAAEYYYPETLMNRVMIFLWVQCNLMMEFGELQLSGFLHLGQVSASGNTFAEPSLVCNNMSC